MKKYLLLVLLLVLMINVSTAQVIITIAGTASGGISGDGGPATNATLMGVESVTTDDTGNLYISNMGFLSTTWEVSNIRKVNTAGIISRFAGIDTVGYSGDGGQATDAKLYGAWGIVTDNNGNVYFNDGGNKRVRKVDKFGIISTFAGNGSSIPSGDGGPATAAGLGYGRGICMDAAGNVYIDAGHKIRKVDAAGIITTFAGTGTTGYSGDGGPATAAQMYCGGQIAADQQGNLFVADHHCIRKINAMGIISTVAGNGTQGYSGDGGAATLAQLHSESGVYADKCNNIYIADTWNHRIRMVNGKGIISTVAGNGTGTGTSVGGFGGDGGPATVAEFSRPQSVYLDRNGNIFVSDELNRRVRYIHMDSCKNTTEAPSSSPQGGEVLSVYPNPSNGAITLNLSSSINEPANVVITNIMGAQVMAFTTTTNKETEINLRVAKGMYFVSVSTASGRWVRKVAIE